MCQNLSKLDFRQPRLFDLAYPTCRTSESLVLQNPIQIQHSGSNTLSTNSLIAHLNSTNLPKITTQTTKMLRRQPTKITLTTEDIAAYEDARAKEVLRETQLHEQAASDQYPGPNTNTMQNKDPNASVGRVRGPLEQKTRAERLGLGMGNGGGSRN